MSDTSSISNKDDFSNSNSSGLFARRRWAHVLALADQLRHNTEVKKDEHLQQYAFDISSNDNRQTVALKDPDHVKSFENSLLFAKTGNFNLDTLSDKFLDLKHTFNHMLEIDKNDIKQVTLATSITKTALLLILRSIESIVAVTTKGSGNFPTLNSLISHIRSRQTELPIQGRLLLDWYNAADMLDLLLNDPDWLVQPRKAHRAMQVCSETLAWTRGVFNKTYRRKSIKRPIFDREDSVIVPDLPELQTQDK